MHRVQPGSLCSSMNDSYPCRAEFDGQHGESGFVAAVPQRMAVAWLQYARCRERRALLEDMLERNEMALVDLLVVRPSCTANTCSDAHL